jgi:hypothetical protein
MSKIYFYNQNSHETIDFEAYITTFNDGIKLNYDDFSTGGSITPLTSVKSLKREITLGFDIVNTNKQMSIDNLKKVNSLTATLYGIRHKQYNFSISDPEIRVLYENLICDFQHDHSAGVEKAGLLCGIINLDVKMELDSGFYTKSIPLPEKASSFDDMSNLADPFIFPKLIKISMTLLTRALANPGVTSDNFSGPLTKAATNFPYRITSNTDGKKEDGTKPPNPTGTDTGTGTGTGTGGAGQPAAPQGANPTAAPSQASAAAERNRVNGITNKSKSKKRN